MISFIIPAHNEAQYLGATLHAMFTAARAAGEAYEVIVVDDSSTDRTGQIARDAGARVERVEHRHIAATRNAGARIARGELLMFVDADTLINAEVVRAVCEAIAQGAVGGGCLFDFDGDLPLWARIFHPVGLQVARVTKLVGGCCMFSTRAAFDAVGGFSEEYYAAEDLMFVRAMKRHGRFVIPKPKVVTSGRKLRQLPRGALLGVFWHVVFRGARKYRQREGLDIWYGER